MRLMRTDNLLCLRRRAFVPATTDSHHNWRVVPNLAHSMQVTGLDQLWVADITYVRLLEEFAFLAVVLDALSRRVVGWALELYLGAALAVAAPQMALSARGPSPGQPIHHGFIEEVYNGQRLHSALNYRAPGACRNREWPRRVAGLQSGRRTQPQGPVAPGALALPTAASSRCSSM